LPEREVFISSSARRPLLPRMRKARPLSLTELTAAELQKAAGG
jgi:hypothetical protein